MFLLLLMQTVKSQSSSQEISLIPTPVSMVHKEGYFLLTEKTLISTPGADEATAHIASQLASRINRAAGFRNAMSSSASASGIRLMISSSEESLGNEGYRLSVNPQAITIVAKKPAGLFYGMQTLLQLFPKEIESKTPVNHLSWKVPCVEITDYPRFAWRGLMLDVCRHFFTMQEVKQYIDEMVKYKYNLLHLHLAEDEGWRIEIKSLPNLTKVGAWRVKREGKWANCKAPAADEPRDYGGFYTQDDIRELVKYAKERYVNILPEIDMPGHSMAAVASYPELSCTPGDYHVNASEEFMVWGANGQQTALVDNTLCPANEKVYEFADKVFSEVAKLFPFEYIHIGGDECAKNFWQKSDAIKALMQKENLKTMEEVQSYYEKRVEKIVESKGKKVMGWDEILEGGLAPNASVMSWRGMTGGIAAAKMNHHVVMSPTDYAYLDFSQGEPTTEPPVYASLRLNKVYTFEPVPQGVDPEFILGGQANLWTEQLPNFRAVEYMMWPRALAISECVWSPADKKDWPDFVSRVEKQFDRMDIAEVKYSRSMYDPIITATKDDNGNMFVVLGKEMDNVDIFYSFDETNPDNFYPKYTSPVPVPKDAATLKVITYRNGIPIGKQINIPVTELRKRAGFKS